MATGSLAATATVLMVAEGGAQVVISNSRRASYGYDQRVEVHGADGMLQVGNQHAAHLTAATASGFAEPVLLDFFMTSYQTELPIFYRNLGDGRFEDA